MTFPDVPCAELTLSEMLLVFFLAILGVIITVVSLFYVYGTFVDIKNYSERISEREIFESYTNIKKNLESSKKTLFFLIISFLASDFFIVCKAPGLLMAFDYRNHDFTTLQPFIPAVQTVGFLAAKKGGNMANALDVAKYIISKCNQEQEPVSNLQLQKILYIIQKTFLQIGGQAFEDDFEAWQIGPVIREVYNQYCGFGGSKIRLSYPDVQVSDKFRKIADFIIISKRKLEPWQIFEEVQEAGGAWDTVYCNGRGDHFIISKDLIMEKCSVV